MSVLGPASTLCAVRFDCLFPRSLCDSIVCHLPRPALTLLCAYLLTFWLACLLPPPPQDVSGVFFVLGLFVAAATVSWIFRRSPWAKSSKERRRRANGGDVERSVLDSYAKMSRRQQKAFTMQATVSLLQDSKVGSVAGCALCTTGRLACFAPVLWCWCRPWGVVSLFFLHLSCCPESALVCVNLHARAHFRGLVSPSEPPRKESHRLCRFQLA